MRRVKRIAGLGSDAETPPAVAEDEAGWQAAEQVLRAQYERGGTLHLLVRYPELPPFQFTWHSIPDFQDHALVYGGRVLRGGGLSAFAEYARAVGLARRPELLGACIGLLGQFDALPSVSFATSSSYERSGDFAPRTEVSDGMLRCVLHYADQRPVLARHRAALADRTAPLRRHGAGTWEHTFEIEVPVLRATVALGPDGPVEWQHEATSVVRTEGYLVFGDELPWWRRMRWRTPIG